MLLGSHRPRSVAQDPRFQQLIMWYWPYHLRFSTFTVTFERVIHWPFYDAQQKQENGFEPEAEAESESIGRRVATEARREA